MLQSQKSRATIFVAEDNPILLQGLDRALSANGYKVATAASGEAVLELLDGAESPPDLLLLDVMMPGISGFDVLRTLQAHPRRRDVPVVLITAATDDSVQAAATEGGAADLLIKPFRLGELLERIETHMALARQRRERPDSAAGAHALHSGAA